MSKQRKLLTRCRFGGKNENLNPQRHFQLDELFSADHLCCVRVNQVCDNLSLVIQKRKQLALGLPRNPAVLAILVFERAPRARIRP